MSYTWPGYPCTKCGATEPENDPMLPSGSHVCEPKRESAQPPIIEAMARALATAMNEHGPAATHRVSAACLSALRSLGLCVVPSALVLDALAFVTDPNVLHTTGHIEKCEAAKLAARLRGAAAQGDEP